MPEQTSQAEIRSDEQEASDSPALGDTALIAASLQPSPITRIQPGGGWCFALERAWGHCRRAWLRRFRPGYVRRMAELRQGHCPSCPHDILDPRDLKLVRNVCGFWFRREDDPFAWRGRLRLARAGLAELLLFSTLFFVLSAAVVLLGVLVHPGLLLLLLLTLTPWLFLVSFFRDPERAIPSDADALVSPADGTVTHVGETRDADFPGGRAFTISIFLSVFNVHVNRLPRGGRVTALRYYPGEFLDARADGCSVRNEQLWIDLTDAQTGGLVRVKQIAGAIARRIVCWLRPDEEVCAGERLGMIKFGSRTEVSVPAELVQQTLVKVGDTVHGGSTTLLRLQKSHAQSVLGTNVLPPIAVFGLYNSGSTALAGALHRLGVDMGRPFWLNSEDNCKENYYEPSDLSRWLRQWWNEPDIRENADRETRITCLRHWLRMRRGLYPGVVGAKHPLLCLCAEDLLEAWGENILFLRVCRPLEESIARLKVRNWFRNHEEPLQRTLWQVVEQFCANRPHLPVEFSRLRNEPAVVLREIAAYAHLKPTASQLAAAAAYIDG